MSEACPLISLQSFALISLQSLALILLQPRAAAVTHKGTIQWNGMDSNVWSCLRRWRVANYRHPLAPGLRQQWRVSNPEPAEVVAPLYALIWIQSFTSQCRHRHNVEQATRKGPVPQGARHTCLAVCGDGMVASAARGKSVTKFTVSALLMPIPIQSMTWRVRETISCSSPVGRIRPSSASRSPVRAVRGDGVSLPQHISAL